MTTVTTRTGDKGTTCIGGNRISKNHPIVKVVGILDHIQSSIGLLHLYAGDYPLIKPHIEQICNDLYKMMGILHTKAPDYPTQEDMKPFMDNLENIIKEVPTPKVNKFLRPNKNMAFANHIRATVRSSELKLWKIENKLDIPPNESSISKYLNRLSAVVYAFMLYIDDNQYVSFCERICSWFRR